MLLRIISVVLLTATPALAEWRAKEVTHETYPAAAFAEQQQPAATITDAGLPDGLIATGSRDIAAAWYEEPTTRYAHAILGDAVEAGSLTVRLTDGTQLSVDLPNEEVFEDRYPRLADLDQDGRDEVITIRASRTGGGGGGVAVYHVVEGKLVEASHVPTIGQSNRWLNIAGIADFHPAPGLEVAFVRTPHIGGTLRLFGWRADKLRLIDEEYGYSNHAIGSPEMRLSATADLSGDGYADMALPSADRRHLKIVTFAEGVEILAEVALPSRVEKAILFDAGAFIVGTRDGKVYRISPDE
ncbi:MAG: hypothetical protein AAF367_15825 [Pseudomonadota bacterium]